MGESDSDEGNDDEEWDRRCQDEGSDSLRQARNIFEGIRRQGSFVEDVEYGFSESRREDLWLANVSDSQSRWM